MNEKLGIDIGEAQDTLFRVRGNIGEFDFSLDKRFDISYQEVANIMEGIIQQMKEGNLID